MKLEYEVQAEIQIEAAKFDCILMRNNSGALKDATGRLVRYGLGNDSKAKNDVVKSSDLIGITTVTVTPEMVGQKIGVFTALEVKREDWKENEEKRTVAQRNFIEWVKLRGGIAGFVSNVDDLKSILMR